MAGAEFVDLQVNGFGGVDFNSADLSGEDLHRACASLQAHSVAHCFATVITDDLAIMCRRLRRLVELRERDALAREVIAGLHIEGPFIRREVGWVGAHPADAVQPATPDAAAALVDAGGGLVRLVTLAPECDLGFKVTRQLSGAGIVVSAGHCDPDCETLSAAIDAGLSMFTHLGNGCPSQLPRHDNIIQRVLAEAHRLAIGLIADNVHIPLFALKNYLLAAGVENCFVVSDAISAAGLGPGRYRLGRNLVDVGDDCAARSANGSHLMGSAVTLARSALLLRQIGLSEEQVHALTVSNPRRFARLDTSQ